MDDKVLESGPIPLRDLMLELYDRSKLSTNHPLPTNAFCGSMRQIRDKQPLFVEWRNTREVLISSSLFSTNDWRWTIDRTDCSDSCYSFKFSGVGKKCADVFIFYVMYIFFYNWIYDFEIRLIVFTQKHGGCMIGCIWCSHWVFRVLQI